MAIDDTWQIRLKGQLLGEQYQVGHYVRQLDNPPGSDWQHLSDQWQAACQTQWLAAHHPAYSLDVIEVQPVVSGGVYLRDASQDFGVHLPGTRDTHGSELEPSWLCQVVTVRSGRAGKRFRGRFFVSNLSEEDVSHNDVVNGAGLASNTLDAYITALKGMFVGPTATSSYWKMVVFSKKQAAVLHATDHVVGAPIDYAPDVETLSRRSSVYTNKSRRPRPS